MKKEINNGILVALILVIIIFISVYIYIGSSINLVNTIEKESIEKIENSNELLKDSLELYLSEGDNDE